MVCYRAKTHTFIVLFLPELSRKGEHIAISCCQILQPFILRVYRAVRQILPVIVVRNLKGIPCTQWRGNRDGSLLLINHIGVIGITGNCLCKHTIINRTLQGRLQGNDTRLAAECVVIVGHKGACEIIECIYLSSNWQRVVCIEWICGERPLHRGVIQLHAPILTESIVPFT